jgi:hypothetical protein
MGLNILLLDEAPSIDLQPLVPSTKILQWQLGQNLQCKGVVPIITSIEGSKVGLEYHIFHYLGPTFILVVVPLCAFLKGTHYYPIGEIVNCYQDVLTAFRVREWSLEIDTPDIKDVNLEV